MDVLKFGAVSTVDTPTEIVFLVLDILRRIFPVKGSFIPG